MTSRALPSPRNAVGALALALAAISWIGACDTGQGGPDAADSDEPDGAADDGVAEADDGDPPFDPAVLPQGDPPVHAPMRAVIHRVVDGDTADVDLEDGTWETVRFLSIDTPELNPSGGGAPECYAEAARDRARALLPVGSTVWLSFDGQYRDRYDRLLAHVFADAVPVLEGWTGWVDLRLVKEGYARAYIWADNPSWADLFQETEDEARAARRGLWGACPR